MRRTCYTRPLAGEAETERELRQAEWWKAVRHLIELQREGLSGFYTANAEKQCKETWAALEAAGGAK